MTTYNVTVQGRGRVNVNRFATHDHDRATVNDDGTMVSEPTETVTLTERQLLQSREMLETIA